MARGKIIGRIPTAPKGKAEFFNTRTVSLSELQTAKPERLLTPKQLEAKRRDDAITKALNDAAALPASQAVVLDLIDGQTMQNYRNAFARIWATEPRKLNVAGRGGTTIFVSRGKLPGKVWNLGKDVRTNLLTDTLKSMDETGTRMDDREGE